MLVKILQSAYIVHLEAVPEIGTVIEVDDAMAANWIEIGLAETFTEQDEQSEEGNQVETENQPDAPRRGRPAKK